MNTNDVLVATTLRGSAQGKDIFIKVKIFNPVSEEDIARCRFEIWMDAKLEHQSDVMGDSGIHALMLALWKIETDLIHKSPFNEIDLEKDEHLGLGFIHSPRVWRSVYGSE